MIEFPKKMQMLERYSERFEAFRLRAHKCEVLFAMYPAGTDIEPHNHDTENWGGITKGELILKLDGKEQRYKPGEWYHVPALKEHAARFEVDTEEIEFWFDAGRA
jgi:quercetin dioxygenase-like cupin family protein